MRWYSKGQLRRVIWWLIDLIYSLIRVFVHILINHLDEWRRNWGFFTYLKRKLIKESRTPLMLAYQPLISLRKCLATHMGWPFKIIYPVCKQIFSMMSLKITLKLSLPHLPVANDINLSVLCRWPHDMTLCKLAEVISGKLSGLLPQTVCAKSEWECVEK